MTFSQESWQESGWADEMLAWAAKCGHDPRRIIAAQARIAWTVAPYLDMDGLALVAAATMYGRGEIGPEELNLAHESGLAMLALVEDGMGQGQPTTQDAEKAIIHVTGTKATNTASVLTAGILVVETVWAKAAAKVNALAAAVFCTTPAEPENVAALAAKVIQITTETKYAAASWASGDRRRMPQVYEMAEEEGREAYSGALRHYADLVRVEIPECPQEK